MNIGLGIKIGRPPPHAIFTWDFTQQSAGALLLPSGVTFTRASSGYSVQDGESLVVVGGAIASNDVPRAGRLSSAHNYGLFVEPPRTNLVVQNRAIDGSPWAVGSSVGTTANAANGPDGAALADRSNVTSGGYSRYQAMTSVVSSSYTFSQWIAARSTAQNHRVALAETVAAYTLIQTSSAPTTWQRINSTRTATTTTLLLPCDGSDRSGTGGPGAQAMDFFTDLHQVELGKYPTSAIVTAGATATRAAERLTIDATRTAASIVNGRLCIYLRFRALAALSEMSSSEGQITCEATGSPTYGWSIGASSKYVYANVGSDYSQSANAVIDWARYDLVEIACEMGGGKSKFRYRRNGGSTTEISFSVRDDTLGAIPSSNGCDILCAGTSFHTPGIVEQIMTFVPGRAPF